MKTILLLVVGSLAAATSAAANDLVREQQTASCITITRDTWGIAHIHGHTDAQTVFGMIYAQAEDDFHRIEMNYLTALGRVAEVSGEGALAQDLRARLYIDPDDLRARFARSPDWLKSLMTAWADGLNYYLVTHPATKPKVLTHFEPWMALAFSEGSIGGDIEDISLPDLAAFYGATKYANVEHQDAIGLREPTGSNGIAIAPSNTQSHHALLLINPHTSFYFRSELQMISDEGLNAYGAATWGQFFLYQGFNQRLGWMHTSTTADNVDQFRETIIPKDGALFTRYGAGLRPVTQTKITLHYRDRDGAEAAKSFTTYKTTHGPVVAKTLDGHWLAEAMMFKPADALAQSFSLTKARTYAEFTHAMELRANTSNNTVYADADGTIAYLHPQFIPRRNDSFDYTHPVDGADPRTDWQDLHDLNDLPQMRNPATGWIQNTNNWPYSVSGAASLDRSKFPRYMDTVGENMRGLHAISLLQGRRGFSLETLLAAAYDSRLPGFAALIPHLLADYDLVGSNDPLKTVLADQIAMLRTWDQRWSTTSVPTTIAVTWGEALWRTAGLSPHGGSLDAYAEILAHTTPKQRLEALAQASQTLAQDFGAWRTPWGNINRFQRRTADIDQPFSDAAPSLPVGFTAGQWGSLAAISGPRPEGVKKRYGDDGNSFVAVVEFGDKVKALAVSAGGESGNPKSPHFADQAQRYVTGALREVFFFPEQLASHVERIYRPGE